MLSKIAQMHTFHKLLPMRTVQAVERSRMANNLKSYVRKDIEQLK